MSILGPNFYKLEKSKNFTKIAKHLTHRKANFRITSLLLLFKYYIELDEKIIDQMKKLTKDRDPSVKIIAVLKFANLGNEEMNDQLYEDLKNIILNGTQRQKIDALRILVQNQKNRDEKISNILILSLKDKNPLVQIETIKALGVLKENLAVIHLVDRLHDFRKSIRLEAVRALGKIGDKSGVEYLVASLADESSDVRLEARNALTLIGTDKAIDSLKDELMPLVKLMNQNVTKRIEIIDYIGKNKLKNALPLLYKACTDEYKNVRVEALKSIGNMRDISSIPEVSRMLEDSYYDVRLEAVIALEKMNHEDALKALESAINDKNSHVVTRAKESHYSLKKRLEILNKQNGKNN